MKLTTKQLQRIIKEEMNTVLSEQGTFVIDEGRFEEDPKFAQDMRLLGKDLQKIIPMLKQKNEKEAERLGIHGLGTEFRAVANGMTRPCYFSFRLDSIFGNFGLRVGEAGQPGIANWLKTYAPCPD